MSSQSTADSTGATRRSSSPGSSREDGPSRPPDEVVEGDGQASLSPSEIHGLLKNPRRRYVVWFLSQTEGTVELRDLAEYVAGWENDKPVDRITSTERKRAYVALYQSHLPRLDEAGVVEFDSDRGIVDRGEYADRVERIFADESGSEREPRHRLYLFAAGASFLGLFGVLAVAGSLSPLVTAYVLVTALAFGGLATADELRSDESALRNAVTRFRERFPELSNADR